ncbi:MULTISPECIES: hypothetical protein [unclassified Microcoleus]|uniref:hypothetical protein n=1 Tax=unclassified Microcoleus TaxID=2642155 RepID=UPI002FD3F435
MILLIKIAYIRDIIEGTIVKMKHLPKYIFCIKEPQKTYRIRSKFESGNDSQQWVNYIEKYAEPVEELMKLTPNKHHFYQKGLRTRTLLRQGF